MLSGGLVHTLKANLQPQPPCSYFTLLCTVGHAELHESTPNSGTGPEC